MAYSLSFRATHSYPSANGSVTVPVSLHAGHETVQLFASVDTGADYCLFERGFAEALLIEVEQGTVLNFRTVGGGFRAYGRELTVSVLGVNVHALVYFFEDPDIKKNVLGREGWLNRVRVGLVDYDSMVYLSAYDD